MGRGRSRDRAEVLAVECVRTRDGGVIRANEQVLASYKVRAAEVNFLLACVRDRVRRKDHVDLPVLDHRLALRRLRLDELDLVLGVAHLVRDVLRDLDVEAGKGVALLEAEARLIELDADLDLLTGSATGGVTRGGRAGTG